jgi:hypothetical protein
MSKTVIILNDGCENAFGYSHKDIAMSFGDHSGDSVRRRWVKRQEWV